MEEDKRHHTELQSNRGPMRFRELSQKKKEEEKK